MFSCIRTVASFLIGLSFAAPALAAATPESFAPLVEKLTPAVVNVYTTQKVESPVMQPFGFGMQLPDDPRFDPFRQFFEGMPRGAMPGTPQTREREVVSLGSGFIVDPSGYVVTNNHVIAKADKVSIKLHEDTELDATIVGRDPKTDLALLKVKSDTPLPFVRFGDSNNVRVGDWVIAIGNPFGLGGSVSAGIISARSRSINAGPFDDFLQTDAAINRGNSGGPMFNINGEVIGINTAIFSPTGGNVGIGFAVPSELAQPVLEQIKKFGRTHRAWLGVKIQPVSEEIAESMGLKDAHGALVIDTTPEGPAAKAGIKSGDIIQVFNGQNIKEMRHLPRLVAESPIGEKVTMQVWRNGTAKTFRVKLEELEEKEPPQAKKSDKKTSAKESEGEAILGMRVATITDSLRQRFRLSKEVKGVLVVDVAHGGVASEQGLRSGDIITQVQSTEVKDASNLLKLIDAAKKKGRKHALVQVQRGSESVFLTLPTNVKK